MYQRFYGGNMDEGWTRWLLEDFQFAYTTIRDADVLDDDDELIERFDVIILPADSRQMMLGLDPGDAADYPPEYRSGFGEEGVAALRSFVEAGGTLVTMAQAGNLVLDDFDVPVRDAVDGMWGDRFWAPGSTLRVRVDSDDPLAYGMPADALATYLAGGQVYETLPGPESADVRRYVTYVDRDILQSGWLLGEDEIANRAAAVSIRKGPGYHRDDRVQAAAPCADARHVQAPLQRPDGAGRAPRFVIDLRSDTVTKPCAGMRAAMAEAPVGDDVYGEDPSVNELEAYTAEILGKDDAVFVPTGTMSNQIAIRVHTEPGDLALVEGSAHIVANEGGGAAAISGVSIRPLRG